MSAHPPGLNGVCWLGNVWLWVYFILRMLNFALIYFNGAVCYKISLNLYIEKTCAKNS